MTRSLPPFACVLLVLVAGICVYAMRQVDPDLFGYLDYGRLIVQHGTPVLTDPFAFTSSGLRWVNFEYLAQVCLWMAYQQFGPLGLIGLKCVLGGVALWGLWVALRASGRDWFVLVPVFCLCASTASRYFIFRPQLFTFAFFALFVAVLFQRLVGRRAVVWGLPIVMLVWANVHGGFVAGLGVIGLVALLQGGAAVNAEGLSVRAVFNATRQLMAVFVACVACTFATPWGWAQWRYVLTELSHGTNRQYIAEWRPPGLQVDPWSWLALTAIVITLIGVGGMAHMRRRLVAGLHPWQWVASACPLIAMAYLSVRHVPLAALWAGPVIAVLGTALNQSDRAVAFRRSWVAVASVSLMPVLVMAQNVASNPAPEIAMGGTTLGTRNPCRVVEFMKGARLSGNVYNPLWWGSYVTWQLYPAVRVAVDGRNISLFPNAMVAENLAFYSRQAGAAELDAPLRYDTDFLLVPSDAAILGLARSDARWRQVYADEDAALFARADGVRAPNIAGAGGEGLTGTPACALTLK